MRPLGAAHNVTVETQVPPPGPWAPTLSAKDAIWTFLIGHSTK